jgi:serine/threonine protein kinase/WD40 repeat protein
MFALTSGQTVRHYRILKRLGAGGMGVVYLARDTNLDRDIALKTLPPDLAADTDRRVRFTREAKALAALNHPGIVTVHSVEETDGLHFITTEFVKGKTLAEIIPASGFELDRFFEIAIPLADALAAAHAQGITHRDLKPANVMASEDGRIKVLDFGLASAGLESSSDGAEVPTRTVTVEGRIVGTPQYMSPEQAGGKRVDARSDIFSLGIVFYEMLAGRRPFAGDSPTSSLLAVIKDTPRPLTEIRPAIPRELARLVHRCLEKNPLDRFQSALDVRHRLEEAKHDVDSGDLFPVESSHPTQRSSRVTWALFAVAAAATAVTVWLIASRDVQHAAPVLRLQNPLQVTSALRVESYPTWSPDGVRVAYQATDSGYMFIGDHDIWVAQLGSGEPVNLTKDSTANDRMPSWSPDGREIAFLSDRGGVWALYAMAAIGGTPRNLLALPGIALSSWSAPQWSRKGGRLFVAVREGLKNVVVVLSLPSLESTRIALPDHEGDLCWDFSVRPDEGRFAYVAAGGGNPEVSRLWTIRQAGDQPVPLTDGRTMVWSPTWSSDGRHLFYVSNRGGSMDLWQQAVAGDGTPVGEPHAITQGLAMRSAAFSPDGTRLAYSRGGRVSNVWRVPILHDRPATWADAHAVTSERAYIEFVDVSRDGRLLAVSSDRRGNQDLWQLPSTGGEMTPLMRDPTPDWNPRWSPDGTATAFYSYRTGNRELWVMPSRGGPARQLTSHPARDWFPSWSPDGREIAYERGFGRGKSEIWIVPATGGEPRYLFPGAFGEWSPDGRWVAVQNAGVIHRVPVDGSPPRVLLPKENHPNSIRFSHDGRSLYYSVIAGPPEKHDIWRLSLSDAKISRLTALQGRRGRLGYVFSADARYLYLTWYEDDGDIWVMDVQTE